MEVDALPVQKDINANVKLAIMAIGVKKVSIIYLILISADNLAYK